MILEFEVLTSILKTSSSGSEEEKRIKEFPHIRPSLQTLLINNFRSIMLLMSFAIALSTLRMDLSFFAILVTAIGQGMGFSKKSSLIW